MSDIDEPYYVHAEFVDANRPPVQIPFWKLAPAINAAVAISEDYTYYRISVLDLYDSFCYIRIVGRGHAKPRGEDHGAGSGSSPLASGDNPEHDH